MMAQDVSIEPKNEKVSVGAALGFFFGLLVAAMVLTVTVFSHDQLAPLFFLAFPFGLITFAVGNYYNVAPPGLYVFVSYVIYVLFLGLFVKVRRRPFFFGVLVLYIAVLICNVAGCTQDIASAKLNCSNDQSIPAIIVPPGGSS